MYLQFAAASKSTARLTLFSFRQRVEAQDSGPSAPVKKIKEYVNSTVS
jgi:hypothetical protein